MQMLPVILGVVALGATGYGVRKLLVDDDFRDNVKEKIQDGAFKAYDGIEKLEEMMGLNEYSFTKEEVSEDPFLSSVFHKGNKKDDFTNLYEYKKIIRDKLQDDYSLIICQDDEIKKDEIKKDTAITPKIKENLNSYSFLIKQLYSKVLENKQQQTSLDLTPTIDILKQLFTTKILKKGTLNEASNEVIRNGMILLIENDSKPIFVDLSS
jgi:hypothetical protein